MELGPGSRQRENLTHGYLRLFVKRRISWEPELQELQSFHIKKCTGQVAEVQDLVQRSRIFDSKGVLAVPGMDDEGQFLCLVENAANAVKLFFRHLEHCEVIGRGDADFELGREDREAEKGGE